MTTRVSMLRASFRTLFLFGIAGHAFAAPPSRVDDPLPSFTSTGLPSVSSNSDSSPDRLPDMSWLCPGGGPYGISPSQAYIEANPSAGSNASSNASACVLNTLPAYPTAPASASQWPSGTGPSWTPRPQTPLVQSGGTNSGPGYTQR